MWLRLLLSTPACKYMPIHDTSDSCLIADDLHVRRQLTSTALKVQGKPYAEHIASGICSSTVLSDALRETQHMCSS